MRELMKVVLVSCFLLCNAPLLFSQTLSGFILDDNNEPVPFANVFIPEQDIATNSNAEGKYSININPGNFDVLVSCIGYEEKRINVDAGDGETIKNIYLKISQSELEEAVVRASGKDPAYAIIKQAVENRKKYLKQFDSYKTHLYIKATEEKVLKEKIQKNKKDQTQEPDDSEDSDELELDNDLETPESTISFLEMDVDFSFQFPNKTKEIRTAYQSYGDKRGFLIPNLNEVNFNFYENLITLTGISDVPIISPIAATSILSYKYKLKNTLFQNGSKIYEIQVTPRKKGNATVRGTIWIRDKTWNISKIQIALPSDALMFQDELEVTQEYVQYDDSTWIYSAQEFDYRSKNKYKTFIGKTTIEYSNFQANYQFSDKYFSNEVGITTEQAYERDSSYWASLRPKPLSEEEQNLVHVTDSINAYHKSPEYLDSLQAVKNKITFKKLFINGLDFWNYKKKQQIYINSISGMLDYSLIDGLRLGPGFNYSRRYESMKFFSGGMYVSSGFKTGFVNGRVNMRYMSNPKKRAWSSLTASRGFVSINPFDAYLSQLQLSNYIRSEQLSFRHRRELVNGLFLWSRASFRKRAELGDLVNPSDILEEIVTSEGEFHEFTPHEAFITTFAFDFTPFQKYMTEPKRKVILGSKWPTFFFDYTKGWDGILSSDVDFDLIEFGLSQKVTLGTFGYSKYNIRAGNFLNTNTIFEMDKKRIRQSDPIFFSEPLNSFQFLDTSLVTTNWFFEGHFLHHFNGALINNIPLVKKLKLRAVAGASFMWVQDSNYRHEELLAGIERVIKIGPRRRLKLGAYGVLANSNKTPSTLGIKLAIDIIDTWQKDWSF